MTPKSDTQLLRAHQHAARGEVLQAEVLYLQVLSKDSACVDAAHALATLAAQREDWHRALQFYQSAFRADTRNEAIRIEMAQVLMALDDKTAAIELLRDTVKSQPSSVLGWLLLGDALEVGGFTLPACKARFLGMEQARRAGLLAPTVRAHPQLLQQVSKSLEKLRVGRREHLMTSFDSVRQLHGRALLQRVEQAVLGYLGEINLQPVHPNQRPKFLYIPGLPDQGYEDPYLQPWAHDLADGFGVLRAEASELLQQDTDFQSFLGLKPGQRNTDYVDGPGPLPAWDAFFFYRHGQRFSENHARCPRSSELLESLTLCRVENQAPEVCFSVLRPGSIIKPHHGVTNSRLVMHLPLIVPTGCALNIVGVGEHAWREGKLMMFDDTFLHEAWNHSDQSRVILLMDCWNPHLTPPEQSAIKLLVEAIDRFENA